MNIVLDHAVVIMPNNVLRDNPDNMANGQVHHPFALRGLFWTEQNQVLFEVMTAPTRPL
jgi:hypothetical protein